MLEVGSLIDNKYRILKEIGRGGMSVVYMALNEKANKTWAIKEVRKDATVNYEAVKQGLIVETDMLKNLNHPNLPSIVDVIEDEDTLIIVMDYIEGNTLAKALSEYGAQPQEYVIEWGKQLCDVLGYLHTRENPIIYRDMKPQNVMLKPDGNLTLIDFGTARKFKESNVGDTICLGTPGYAAVEQYGGQGQTDARTDIFGLGATLYHLVTGVNPSQPPYELKPIREINPALSSGLEKIILKCTKINPADRYQSCAELMYALEHYDEIDDLYRSHQKRKLITFVLLAVFTVLFAISGFVTGFIAGQMATDNYAEKMEEALITGDINTKENLYKEAIAIPDMNTKIDAYLGLVNLYKEDSVFTVKEQENTVKIIQNNKADLMGNQETYAQICFEVGKLYWYYYENVNQNANQVDKMKASVEWFANALQYSNDEFEYKGMATVYSEIGLFYRDIAIKTIEADDKGLYKPFFENIKTLLDTISKDENESEIVKLELYQLTQSAMQQYATKFKTDGVSKEDIELLLENLTSSVNLIEATTDLTNEKKETIKSMLADTESSVQIAYSSSKEGE